MRLLYITVETPYGPGEAFILPEVRELQRLGHTVHVAPVRPGPKVVHRDAASLRPWTLRSPLIGMHVVIGSLRAASRTPRQVASVLALLAANGRLRVRIRNLAVLPKALWLSEQVRSLQVDHIHAHWGSTPSTVALIVGRVSGVPWSFTCHLWDIAENNILKRKTAEAVFCRTIDLRGARKVEATTGYRPVVLHMGVEPSPEIARPQGSTADKFVSVANMVEKKGFRYLVRAAQLLRERGVRFTLDLIGDGPQYQEIRGQVERADLASCVRLLGQTSHDEILRGLAAGRWDIAVIASVVSKGEAEGIPVFLMEAMGAGLPTIGTRVGGIPELMEDAAGVLVRPADPTDLADAMQELVSDADLRNSLSVAGRARVLHEYNVREVAPELVKLMRDSKRTWQASLQAGGDSY
jgi:colanic acid/amylovoran biosynthesis glycosyltransferase